MVHLAACTAVAHTRMVYLAACTTGGSHGNGSSGGVYHWWLTHRWFIWRRVPLVAHTNGFIWRVAVYLVAHTRMVHLAAYHWWLTHEWFIWRRTAGGSHTNEPLWRRVPLVAHTNKFILAACTTGGSRTNGFIWRRVPLGAHRTYLRMVHLAACHHWWLTRIMVYLAACTTGGSHTNGSSGSVYHWCLTRMVLAACVPAGGSHTNGSSGGVYHWWLHEWFIGVAYRWLTNDGLSVQRRPYHWFSSTRMV
ncbi:hypothetical protein AVEN_175917-1 [Araneus ventricosus]|uniref:Uncharacterized protein n=1 Tax=Araneus ventricosus TaxID=182803 RepID=A0A4Y2JJ51_ARAVE|nr:hypothetical protein AVEN_175917-1 [Araneus ventricosus]